MTQYELHKSWLEVGEKSGGDERLSFDSLRFYMNESHQIVKVWNPGSFNVLQLGKAVKDDQ